VGRTRRLKVNLSTVLFDQYPPPWFVLVVVILSAAFDAKQDQAASS